MGTDFKPGADTRLAGLIERCLQLCMIHLQVVHFLVICFSTLVGQKRLKLFLGVYRYFITECSFRHSISSKKDKGKVGYVAQEKFSIHVSWII